jgi:hypothetical protein
MATHKVKVIGPFEVAGIPPGEEGAIDDAAVVMKPLLDAQLIELVAPKAKAKKSTAKKGEA